MSTYEGNVVIDLFMLASENEEWLHADGLKEMMRCTLDAPHLLVPSRQHSITPASSHVAAAAAVGLLLPSR